MPIEEMPDIMDEPKNLYVNGRPISNIDVKNNYARVTVKKSGTEFTTSFDTIDWHSPGWDER